MKRIIVLGAAVGAILVLAACGPKAKPVAAAAPSVAPSAAAAPSPSAPEPSASKTNQAPPSAGPHGGSPGFTAALAEWKKGASASSATQGAFWTRAAADLESGVKTDSGRTDDYAFAISALKDLAKLPSGQQSSGQNMQFHIDIESLDSFFSTPGLYS